MKKLATAISMSVALIGIGGSSAVANDTPPSIDSDVATSPAVDDDDCTVDLTTGEVRANTNDAARQPQGAALISVTRTCSDIHNDDPNVMIELTYDVSQEPVPGPPIPDPYCFVDTASGAVYLNSLLIGRVEPSPTTLSCIDTNLNRSVTITYPNEPKVPSEPPCTVDLTTGQVRVNANDAARQPQGAALISVTRTCSDIHNDDPNVMIELTYDVSQEPVPGPPIPDPYCFVDTASGAVYLNLLLIGRVEPSPTTLSCIDTNLNRSVTITYPNEPKVPSEPGDYPCDADVITGAVSVDGVPDTPPLDPFPLTVDHTCNDANSDDPNAIVDISFSVDPFSSPVPSDIQPYCYADTHAGEVVLNQDHIDSAPSWSATRACIDKQLDRWVTVYYPAPSDPPRDNDVRMRKSAVAPTNTTETTIPNDDNADEHQRVVASSTTATHSTPPTSQSSHDERPSSVQPAVQHVDSDAPAGDDRAIRIWPSNGPTNPDAPRGGDTDDDTSVPFPAFSDDDDDDGNDDGERNFAADEFDMSADDELDIWGDELDMWADDDAVDAAATSVNDDELLRTAGRPHANSVKDSSGAPRRRATGLGFAGGAPTIGAIAIGAGVLSVQWQRRRRDS